MMLTLAPSRRVADPPIAAFAAAAEPGLFDRPDRAIAAMRFLLLDWEPNPDLLLTRLTERLQADGGTRFWTEREMRLYAQSVNELLGSIGVGIMAPDGRPSQLGVKVSRTRPDGQGRYALFYFQPRRASAPGCRRTLPDNLMLTERLAGPS